MGPDHRGVAGLGYHEVAILTPSVTATELPYYPAFAIYAFATGTLLLLLGGALYERNAEL